MNFKSYCWYLKEVWIFNWEYIPIRLLETEKRAELHISSVNWYDESLCFRGLILSHFFLFYCFTFCIFKNLSPRGNTPQGTNYTATCPSRKLYKLDEPDMQDTAGEARTNSSVMYSYGPSHMAKQKQDDQLEHTYSNYVRIRDVALKTCQKRWIIGRCGERGSGISMLTARHDDDDDDDLYLYAALSLIKSLPVSHLIC